MVEFRASDRATLGVSPGERSEFLLWSGEEANWSKVLDQSDPENLLPVLSGFFLEFIKSFPPMNGPLKSNSDSPTSPHANGKINSRISVEFENYRPGWDV